MLWGRDSRRARGLNLSNARLVRTNCGQRVDEQIEAIDRNLVCIFRQCTTATDDKKKTRKQWRGCWHEGDFAISCSNADEFRADANFLRSFFIAVKSEMWTLDHFARLPCKLRALHATIHCSRDTSTLLLAVFLSVRRLSIGEKCQTSD